MLLIWFGAPLYSNDEFGKGVKIEKFAAVIQLKERFDLGVGEFKRFSIGCHEGILAQHEF